MSEYHVGITATHTGMSVKQCERLLEYLQELRAMYWNEFDIHFHHGDCIGGDAQGHEIALNLGCKIHIHPPTNPKNRAFCTGAFKVYPVKPYILRDHDIVDSISVLFAGPKDSNKEEIRSGTWTTVRYAKKQDVPYILLPR